MTNSLPDSSAAIPPGSIDWYAGPLAQSRYVPVPRHPPLKTLVLACLLFLITLCTCLVAGTQFAAAYAQNQAVSWEEFIRAFTLVYSISNCCFNGPPKVQHFVAASVLPGGEAEYSSDLVDVVGTLHVGVQTAEGHVQSVYRIDVEKVSRG